MKEFRSYIDEETGERVSGLFDMRQEQIAALEASRTETQKIEEDREAAEMERFRRMAEKLGYVPAKQQ
jgi:hypothetical protein